MSTQEIKLKAIADAIREKEGTTDSIPANDFPARILAIPTGGGLPDYVRTITLTADPPEGGTVSGGGVAQVGMTVKIGSEPNTKENYLFKGWFEEDKLISEENSLTFQISQNREIIAIFLQKVFGWQEADIPVSGNCYVSYVHDRFILIAYAYSTYSYAYSTDGIVWTSFSMPVSGGFGFSYGGGKFVAIASNSANAAYSTDGISWTKTSMPSNALWSKPVYGNGVFVSLVSGTNSSKAAYSEDGINWTAVSLPSYGDWNTPFFGNGVFVSVIRSSSNKAAYSEDGKNWVSTTLPLKSSWKIIYGNSIFVALGNASAIAYSKDGENWVISPDPDGTMYYNNLIYGETVGFIGIAQSTTNKGIHSIDGINWTSIQFPITASWSGAEAGGNKAVLTGTNPYTSIYTEDGVNWLEMPLPVSQNWNNIAYGDGKFVAAGQSTNIVLYTT